MNLHELLLDEPDKKSLGGLRKLRDVNDPLLLSLLWRPIGQISRAEWETLKAKLQTNGRQSIELSVIINMSDALAVRQMLANSDPYVTTDPTVEAFRNGNTRLIRGKSRL